MGFSDSESHYAWENSTHRSRKSELGVTPELGVDLSKDRIRQYPSCWRNAVKPSTYPLQGCLPVALWFNDAVPVGLAALVVVCVADEISDVRIQYPSYRTTEVHTSWIWPCRIDEGRVRYLGGADVGLWLGVESKSGVCFTVDRELPCQSKFSTESSHVCNVGICGQMEVLCRAN